MGSRKTIRKNLITKTFVLLFSFTLKKYYLIYEDEKNIVFLEKGKTINISKLFSEKK